jgi:hypothetical protein
MDDFCRVLLCKRPSVAEITWESPQALQSFLHALGPALRRNRPDTVLARLSGEGMDRESFQRELVKMLGRRNGCRRCLLVCQIESLLSAAGTVLNGFRERLGGLRALIIVIRQNRRCDFVAACPDLMDWVGHNIGRTEDLGPPFTLANVVDSIRILEHRHGMRSGEFQKKWKSGVLDSRDEYSLWAELIALRASLREGGKT